MLIRFEVVNFRSILDPVELSMVAVDRDRGEARPIENLGESLLTVAAIYGPNASGKSNMLAALTWLRAAVEESLRFWDDEIPVDPFAFADGPDRASEFTVEAVVDGVRFEYTVELDRRTVRYEALFHYPARRRRVIFEREGQRLRLQRGLGGIAGTRELLTDRTLVLSIARRFDEPLVNGFVRSLLSAQTLGVSAELAARRPRRLTWGDLSSANIVQRGSSLVLVDSDRRGADWLDAAAELPADRRARLVGLLRLADLGVDDIVIDDPDDTGRPRVRLVHRSGDARVPLDLAAESHGTRTWLTFVGPALDALAAGSPVLVDELDASLHPTLSAELIRLFHHSTTNPRGAQLIFTTHDTSLLNHLNRDEVWLTEKDGRGATRLGALAEFAGERVRRAQNLERAYLHGRFGALPDLDRAEMLRALGLVG